MKWWRKLLARSGIMYEVSAANESMRSDINANTSECAKLLYRLEEAELQIKNSQVHIEQLQQWHNRISSDAPL